MPCACLLLYAQRSAVRALVSEARARVSGAARSDLRGPCSQTLAERNIDYTPAPIQPTPPIRVAERSLGATLTTRQRQRNQPPESVQPNAPSPQPCLHARRLATHKPAG